MREHHVNKRLNNFIGGYYLEDTSFCDEIIEYFNYNSELQSAGVVGDGEGNGRVNPAHKKSIDITIGPERDLTAWNKVISTVQSGLEKYLEAWSWSDNTNRFIVKEPFNIQKYNPGDGFYGWHMENSGGDTLHRHLVWMVYLNDVTNRGQTEFLYQKLKVKPEKGLMLFWPAGWTHVHRGIPSPTQEKYIATGWYSFVEE